MSIESVPLAGGIIDRDAVTRASAEALEQAWNESGARVLRLHGALVPVRHTAAGMRLELVLTSECDVAPHERWYLGRSGGDAVFTVQQGNDAAAPEQADVEWMLPLEVGMRLEPSERELVVVASALSRWHETGSFSPRDGGSTNIADGGWSRRDAHGGEHFPRTDPAVIVLIEHGNSVLLGSNALWESGRFSLLAGFVEAGESLENAVEREIFEEAGVRVTDIRYRASQPWPFPRSLMVGFRARLADGQDPDDLTPDITEISELRWFTREEIANPPAGITYPGEMSIARWLIDDWVAEGNQ